MKFRPIHENLDTSFVNLSALISYLRRRHFSGCVRIGLNGYQAEIYLTAENRLKAREYDEKTGRVAEDEETIQRILIRAREPGGSIDVYQAVGETTVSKENERENIGEKTKPPHRKDRVRAAKTMLPDLPLEFSNKVEEHARTFSLSGEERELLLNLTGELLGTVDRSLATANLQFQAAFQKACTEVSADYPFLKTLDYADGKISCDEPHLNQKFFVAGVFEVLRRILDRLGANPKFTEVHRAAGQQILALLHRRRDLYDRFSMTEPLEKILGV